MLSFLLLPEDTAKELNGLTYVINFTELTNALQSLRLFVMMSPNSTITNVLQKMLFTIIKARLLKSSWKTTRYLAVQLAPRLRHLEPIAHF